MNLRTQLYAEMTLKVIYNPMEATEAPYDIVDLTVDVSNQLKLMHKKTDEVRKILADAKLVVSDNPVLADAIKDLDNVTTISIVAGRIDAQHTTKRGDDLVYGILAHDSDYFAVLSQSRAFLKSMDMPLTVFGEEGCLDKLNFGIELTYIEKVEEFAALVDVVLIPAKPKSYLSPTIVMALIGAGLVVIATSIPTFNEFQPTAGVELVRGAPLANEWRKLTKKLSNRSYLYALQERNRKHAQARLKWARQTISSLEVRYLR